MCITLQLNYTGRRISGERSVLFRAISFFRQQLFLDIKSGYPQSIYPGEIFVNIGISKLLEKI